jgi:electron transport complex protein RnfA
MDIGSLFVITISAIFVSNFVLMRFLGLCPYMGVSRQLDSAVGMGMAVTFVMSVASAVTWVIYYYLLSPETNLWGIDLTYLRTVSFILVIAALVQFIEMVVQKTSPSLYRALGIYLPLITTNCAILGVSLLNIDENYDFIGTLVNGFSSGLGFTLALILMAGLRERLELMDVPESFRGLPIAFILAACMSIAFFGFAGLSVE